MPVATKKRSPMPPEAEESKAHEQGESPKEEVREGSESEEMPRARGNRKRSPKGAKRTKAPMDSDCGCGGGKGKPCSCKDSGCGDYQKMDSALTPQEYLAACDLGIQGRSRSYIRTRLTVMDSLTPATVQFRYDKKCGASAIPDNKQCRVGAGGGGGLARKVATGAAIAGGVAAAAYGVSRMRRGGSASSAIVPYSGGGGRMPSNLSRNGLGNRARRAAYNAGSRVRGAATNLVEGRRSGSFTRTGSIGNRVRQVQTYASDPMQRRRATRSLRRSIRQVGQKAQSARNSYNFAMRGHGTMASHIRGTAFSAANNPLNMLSRRHYSNRNSTAIVRRGDDVWADGFTPEYA